MNNKPKFLHFTVSIGENSVSTTIFTLRCLSDISKEASKYF